MRQLYACVGVCMGGASHGFALKFKESAGDGGRYLLNTYAEYLMSERFTSPSYQTYGTLRILPRLKDAACAAARDRPLKYVRAIHNKYNGQCICI